jgi:hypothetical protein
MPHLRTDSLPVIRRQPGEVAVMARFLHSSGRGNVNNSPQDAVKASGYEKEIQMKATASAYDMQEIHRRAAEVRGNWSDVEKRRRMGLPPDTPVKIRKFVTAPRIVSWPKN